MFVSPGQNFSIRGGNYTGLTTVRLLSFNCHSTAIHSGRCHRPVVLFFRQRERPKVHAEHCVYEKSQAIGFRVEFSNKRAMNVTYEVGKVANYSQACRRSSIYVSVAICSIEARRRNSLEPAALKDRYIVIGCDARWM
jgi:hypothetical protein